MFLLNLCVEGRAGTLSNLDLLKSGLLLNLLLGLVHGLRILRHQLHGNLRGVLDLAPDLPVDDTEIDVCRLENVDGRVEELSVEEVTIENHGGKTHATLQA